MTIKMMTEERPTGGELTRSIGLPGRIAVTWALAGGLLLGGFLVAGMSLAGRLSGGGLLVTSAGLFVIGAALGYLHGAVLGFVGRPADMTRSQALQKVALGAVYALPVLALGWILAGWVCMAPVARYLGRTLPLIGVGCAVVVGVIGLGFAAVYGWRGMRNAYARWPERRVGTVLVFATYAALLVLFLADRPELWGSELRVTETGAVLLASMVTFWMVGPGVTLALAALRRLALPMPALEVSDGRGLVTAIGVGLATGGVLALLALPFQGAPYGAHTFAAEAGTVGTVLLGLGAALFNEVLLRLVLVTAVAAFVLRRMGADRLEAGAAGVVAAAVVQVLLYLPAVVDVGFASSIAAAGYVILGVMLPALVFGFLYWTRGLGTAVVAHATALVVLALMVA